MLKMSKETDVSLASLLRVVTRIRRASAEAVSVCGWNQLSARTFRTQHTAAHVMTSLAGTVRPRRNKSIAAFTLVELLAAVLIILVLTGVIAGVSSYVITRANISRSRAEIAAISMALESFKQDTGAYPPASGSRAGEEYKGLLQLNQYMTFPHNSATQKKIYMTFTPRQVLQPNRYLVDPWGNFYGYRCPGKVNPATFDLWSYGPDGTNGQDPRHPAGRADDISN